MRLLDGPDGRPELLALRALKLGDLLVAVPALHALRRSHPEHRMIFAGPGWLGPIVELVGGIDALLPTPGLDAPLPLDSGRIDVAVNLHGNGPESAALIAALDARRVIAHRAAGHGGPAWRDGIHERERWAGLVAAHGMPASPGDVAIAAPDIDPAVADAAVLHVGAFYGSRRWPVDRFAHVARALAAELPVVFTGSSDEAPRARAVAQAAGLPESSVLAGRLELAGFAAVVNAARLVVSADTGAAHLATAYRRPSVVLFGPAPPEEWGPPANGPHIVLTDSARRVGDTFGSDPDPALLAVTPQHVIAAAHRLLSGDR